MTSQLQVLLALGNVPGGNFNTVLVPTFQEAGPENFVSGDVRIPENWGVTEGMNGMIQVILGGIGVAFMWYIPFFFPPCSRSPSRVLDLRG